MEVLRQLVQTIVVIVIMAVFLEMLLPRSDMRRYVKMVMGLLIIIAVLQNATAVVHGDIFKGIPGVIENHEGREPVSLDEVMTAGRNLAEKNNEEAAQKYSEGIARQVLSLANMNTEIKAVDAKVEVDENTTRIKKISLIFAPQGSKDQTSAEIPGNHVVQPVIVETGGNEVSPGNQGEPEASDMQAAAKVALLIANFYNLGKEQVEIKFQ